MSNSEGMTDVSASSSSVLIHTPSSSADAPEASQPMEDNVLKRPILIKYLDQEAPPQERLVFKQKEMTQEIWDSMTVTELRKAFEETLEPKPGFNAERIFIYQGRILKKDMKLGDLKLNDKSFLICVLKRLTPIVEEKKNDDDDEIPIPAPGPRVIQAQQYNEEVITNLMGLGSFPRDMVIACLQAAYGNADRAAEYLFTGIPERTTRVRLPHLAARVLGAATSTSSSSSSTATTGAETPSHPWNEFAVGDIIDAQDQSEHWYEATIREVKEDSVLVHYNGWSTRWDEWLPRDSARLGPRGSHSARDSTATGGPTPAEIAGLTAASQAAAALLSRGRSMLTAARTRSRSTTAPSSSSSSSSIPPSTTSTDTTTTSTTTTTTSSSSSGSESSSTPSDPTANPWELFANSFSALSPPMTGPSLSSTTSATSTTPSQTSPSPSGSVSSTDSTTSSYQPREAVQRPAADLNQQIQARLQERMSELEEQIRTQMRQAFFDVLEQKLAADPPDYDWVIKLYIEIRERIGSLTPNRQDFQAELKEQMDDELFAQMLRSNAYDGTQLHKLVHFVFGRIEFLEAPARNQSTRALLASLDQELQKPDCKFSTFVPLFLRHAHTKLDEIEQDIRRIHTIVRGRTDEPSRT